MKKVFKIIIVAVVVFLIIFAGFAILGFYRMYEKDKTDAVIERINSTKITLADVMGENLPPKPDQQLNDSTIAGIDANNNFIRDDVEIAIFERYPDSAKIRAAMLQYAQALQLGLTEVFNSETLVSILQKRSYSQSCIGETGPEINLKDTREKIKTNLAVSDNRVKEVEGFIINTDIRKKRYSDVLNYTTTYSIPAKQQQCDIDLASLPN